MPDGVLAAIALLFRLPLAVAVLLGGAVAMSSTAIVVRQLVSSGVLATNVDASAPCTACHPEKFASYFLSRDMTRGMLSAISIRPSVD